MDNNCLYRVVINLRGGKGGNGSVSFWKTRYQPLGGPDGGDGGKGGDVYLRASGNITDMSVFRGRRIFIAENGDDGGRQKKHGKDGKDLIIDVPIGTTVYRKENGDESFVSDLDKEGKILLIARGGKGGIGNARLATSTNQAPARAISGKLGEEICVILEYQMMSDVAIIGPPNSGKSSLINFISSASAKVADYPFTTVKPIVGELIIKNNVYKVVEIPAVVQSSHQGKGLGNKFLKNVDRTRLILYLLDGTSEEINGDFNILKTELEVYNAKLLSKQQIIVINKIDIEEVKQKESQTRKLLEYTQLEISFISAKNGIGIKELLDKINDILSNIKDKEPKEDNEEYVFRPKPLSRKK